MPARPDIRQEKVSKSVATSSTSHGSLEFHPLTPDRWHDLEALFGARGACGGCWCMWWRLTRAEFDRQKGDGNRAAFRQLVESGTVPGVLAYDGHDPAGWCAIQPRNAYPSLQRSRVLKPVDAEPVWSITCFFVARRFRRKGLTVQLLSAAAEYAAQRGATVLEGYPVLPRSASAPDPWLFTGTLAAFQQAGFTEVARYSPTRPIMRVRVAGSEAAILR